MKNKQKTLTLWLVLILMMGFVMKFAEQNKVKLSKVEFSQLINEVKEGHVEKVEFRPADKYIKGTYKADYNNGEVFESNGNLDNEFFTKTLNENGIIANYVKEEEPSLLSTFLMQWFPLLLVFGLFIFFLKQIQAGGGKAMSFGKSKAKMLNESEKKVTFDDVAGVNEAKEELVEVVDFLKDPKKYTSLGGKIPKGVLLIGPPGTGKTLLAKAVAGEAGVPFFSISGSDFVEMFVGVGASRVRDLFEQGKKHAPCIIFIDEIDAVGRHRGSGMGGGHDEREQTLNQLLVEMDGFESNAGVILIAATNRIDVLDPALLRPGRFDRRVHVGRPDVRGRLGVLNVHTSKNPLDEDVNLETIARGTPGFTGADLANLVNEAALLAARESRKKILNIDFENAKDKVLMGVARKSMVISDDEKKNTAYHEAGHALVSSLLPKTDPLHKVTIIPRGGALGITQYLPEENRLSLTLEKAKNQIATLMGGRVAEELMFGEISTGASNDIEKATEMAVNMVCHWGMSKELGPISLGKSRTNPFNSMGGQEFENVVSELTAQKIDKEVSHIVQTGYELATKLLSDNKDTLINLSESLIKWETLDASQVSEIVAGVDIGEPEMIVRKKKTEDSDNDDSKKESTVTSSKNPISGSKIIPAT